jgi:hypothetical protein
MLRFVFSLFIAVLAWGHISCKPDIAANSKSATAQPAAAKPAAASISRIVFVDLDKCCDCTRKRIDSTWKALTDVVGFPPVIDVERIHMDTDKDGAAFYKKMRPVMVPPAIYFFDKQNKLVEMLQGEVKTEQIKRVLGSITDTARSG